MALFFLLLLPLLVLAQSTSQPKPTVTVVTSASLTTIVTLGNDRQISTITSSLLFTTTIPLTPTAQPSGSGSGTNGNSTPSGNSSTSASSTSKAPLPTAPSGIDGGGDRGAPMPGQTGVGGAYGPDDQYIAAATSLKYNGLAVGAAGVVLGGVLIVF